jgi:hypothetical protein
MTTESMREDALLEQFGQFIESLIFRLAPAIPAPYRQPIRLANRVELEKHREEALAALAELAEYEKREYGKQIVVRLLQMISDSDVDWRACNPRERLRRLQGLAERTLRES